VRALSFFFFLFVFLLVEKNEVSGIFFEQRRREVLVLGSCVWWLASMAE
jgi:hypothetical protein